MTDPLFWENKKVLVTGHTGFKGCWLALWLRSLGAKVTGVALPAASDPNLFDLVSLDKSITHHVCDIRESKSLQDVVSKTEPDIVFHLAAQALVRKSYTEPLTTFSSNIMGTANLLEVIRNTASTRVVVAVTTDKVYADNANGTPYTETAPLGGHDPYSASKAASELVIESYRKSFYSGSGVALASARAGNVIGGGDWSDDRLLPDAIRAWQDNRTLQLRMPDAIRPWQHVLDPLNGYLQLAEMLWSSDYFARAWNFGPLPENAVSVRQIIDLARKNFGRGEVEYGQEQPDLHEANLLRLDTGAANKHLGVEARLGIEQSVAMTMNWHKALASGADAKQLCLDDIAEYGRLS